ncbi:tRNA-guanine(15) transglycosylase-like protein [Fomes fomentarius]|nr:tRNA-guanine(15) transglycosylase-like protein [Fomes fomentarius]
MADRPLFTPSFALEKFGPRTGTIEIDREDGTPVIQTNTPGLLTATSRGLVPHLSRDHVHLTGAIRHIQLPFESFLDRNPPVPTLVGGSHPLHSFLSYSPEKHVILLTLRDPSDGRKMPPNGNDHVSAHCTRGVRKVDPSVWKAYVQKCKPDIVVALSDTPFTPPPHSQKRLTKSIERSISWLVDILRTPSSSAGFSPTRPQNVLVHLAGGAIAHARAEFADRLTEPIERRDAAGLAPYNTLDDGVAGYVFDLLPLHIALSAEASRSPEQPSPTDELVHVSDRQRSSSESSARLAELLQASLEPLPSTKPRIVNSPASPHEILRLVRDVGIDLVDASWAQRAADIGIALDFSFPVSTESTSNSGSCRPPRTRAKGKLDLGHNLFDPLYRSDHSRLSSVFADGNAVDIQAWQDSQFPLPPSALKPPFVRSYIHHLLHTHEMSSHSLITMHNLTVLSAFLDGIRAVLSRGITERSEFAKEVERFEQIYDEELLLWDEAEKMWLEVEHARGKGRLAREKEKQVASTISTAVDG